MMGKEREFMGKWGGGREEGGGEKGKGKGFLGK